MAKEVKNFSNNFNDSKLYITKFSNLEEIIPMVVSSTLSGMVGTKENKKNCINDTLKILNFRRHELESRREETIEEEPDSIKSLKEESMLLCSNYNTYMRSLCTEGCNFITENHNILNELIESSKKNLDSVIIVKEKYRGINDEILEDAYNERILSMQKKFEEDVKSVKEKKFECSMKREEITEQMNKCQSKIFSLYKNVDMEKLLNAKKSYEYDFYEIEKSICKLFEEYLVKWSKSLEF